MSEAGVRKRVITFFVHMLQEILGQDVKIIQARQDVAVPFESYVVVDLLGERSLGDFEQWDTETETINIACLRQAILNIQGFGYGSVELLSTIWGNLERPTIVDKFQDANIAVNIAGEVQDLTNLLDGRGYQERASLDLTISYDRNAVDDPGWFELVHISGKFTNKEHGADAVGIDSVTIIKTEKENE